MKNIKKYYFFIKTNTKNYIKILQKHQYKVFNIYFTIYYFEFIIIFHFLKLLLMNSYFLFLFIKIHYI